MDYKLVRLLVSMKMDEGSRVSFFIMQKVGNKEEVKF